ncbi:glycosyltransferase family 39 protein [Streptomyces sp. NBC_00091]|uniref:glycosyltransferase family 39 protein n=1 Tax=Streptomyces sp. NBC_00091 TaxID=2975648 RepID=UPI0022538617|nr:glycosyltransferase family 39 protein [Streptomyces sp. NBC_00091]MCX5378021.1 glycosyltransferase family 39 protein [Streptomyces sp. NBC_00091]
MTSAGMLPVSPADPPADSPADPRPGTGAGPATPRRLPGPDWLWAALLTLVVTAFGIGRAEPWRDELASWNAATRSTGELIDMLGRVDAVSGLYYLLLHGWVSVFGDSTAMLRLPSALAMAAAAAFAVLTARRLFDRRTAVFTGLLFAFVPAVSRYGQEARSYAFVVLAVTAATWLLLRALERPALRRWAPYALAVAAAGLFHVVSLLFLLPHGLIVLLRWWQDRRGRTLVAYAVTVAAALLPVIPLVLLGQRQVGRQISWIKTPHLRSIADLWSNLFGSPMIGLAIAAVALLPLAWSRGRRPAVELALVGAAPIGAAWVVSQGSTSYFMDRYLLFTLPAWVVLAAAGLAALRPRRAGALALAALILLGLPDQRQMRTEWSRVGLDGEAAARVIAKGYRPGDGFVPVRGADRVFMIDFQVEYYLPQRVQLRDVFAERSALASDDLFPQECARPVQCLGSTQRVWVVTWSGTKNPYHKLPKEQAEALESHYRVAESQTVRGLRVSLLERVR